MNSPIIQRQVSLKNSNTFRVEALASKLLIVKNEKDILDFFNSEYENEKLLVLGGGSNILFTQNFEGVVLKMENEFISIIEGDSSDEVLVEAGAGVNWNKFVWFCVDNNLAGIENMALIPGTVGASPIQNIGAYGTELMDVFYSCKAYDILEKKIVTLYHKDCEFSYRDSIFKNKAKGRYIILSVIFKLSKTPHLKMDYAGIKEGLKEKGIQNPSIKDMAEIISSIRTFKLPDPSEIGNAGSFFKNPIVESSIINNLLNQYPDLVFYPMPGNKGKIAAGWLIENAGWKGKQIGNCATWKNQALVLVNTGEATGKELYDFSEKIVEDVAEKFGITLEREVNIL